MYYIKFRKEQSKWVYAGITDYEQAGYFLVNLNVVYEDLKETLQIIYRSPYSKNKYIEMCDMIYSYINTNLIAIAWQQRPKVFYSDVGNAIISIIEGDAEDGILSNYFN